MSFYYNQTILDIVNSDTFPEYGFKEDYIKLLQNKKEIIDIFEEIYDLYEKEVINIKVSIYLYACPVIENEENISIDYKMYNIAEQKDRKIKAVEHLLKQGAIDCELFKERNLRRHENLDFSRDCEFNECSYECNNSNLQLSDIDYTTYNLYYNSYQLTTIIKQLFKRYFFVRLESLKKMFMGNRLYDILIVMNKLITQKTIIKNKYNIHCHIQQENDVFFLVYVEDTIPTQKLSYYYNENIHNQPQISLIDKRNIIQQLNDTDDNDYKKILLENLDVQERFELLQNAIQRKLDISLQNFLLEYFIGKFFKIRVFENDYFVITMIGKTDLYFLKDNVWINCKEDDIGKEIINLYSLKENEKKERAKSLGLSYYGLIEYDNDKGLFKLKKIQSTTQINVKLSKEPRGIVCSSLQRKPLSDIIESLYLINDIKPMIDEYKEKNKIKSSSKSDTCKLIKESFKKLGVIFYETYNDLIE